LFFNQQHQAHTRGGAELITSKNLDLFVEGVAGFGKAIATAREIQVQAGKAEPIPTGTVTETVMACSVGQERGIEVRENCGAGDPD
jgi:hypothetical protein